MLCKCKRFIDIYVFIYVILLYFTIVRNKEEREEVVFSDVNKRIFIYFFHQITIKGGGLTTLRMLI